MDLCDYKDVAENNDRYWEVMYKSSDNHEGDEVCNVNVTLEKAKEIGDKI